MSVRLSLSFYNNYDKYRLDPGNYNNHANDLNDLTKPLHTLELDVK